MLKIRELRGGLKITYYNVLDEALKIKEDLVRWRRHLHKNPELSFEEYETNKFVKNLLEKWGYTSISSIAKTGLVVNIKGKEEGATIALRADMDALPINDEKQVSYASKKENIAHLCGHDAHTSILLGVAELFSKIELEKGNIKLIFQPAEEGFAGAKYMVEEGVLKNPDVNAIAGLHVHPTAQTGEITVAKDIAMATSDQIDIEIIGKGGHAAHPHLSIDPIAITSIVISSLQQVVSRSIDPLEPVVVTIGKVQGGYKRNIIAPSVKLEGTVRILNKDLREDVRKIIKEHIEGICNGMGADYEFNYTEGYPSVVNDNNLIQDLAKVSNEILGQNTMSIVKPSMGGEDFSYYTEKVPGLFFRLGTRNENKQTNFPNHHPLFDIDEDALPYGVALLSGFALNYLNEN
ncbi:M20 metallopeptidase family protein [Salinicoccus kekensis]|uniref:M20 metallopeptidase family protein n=1 Tax=Salinicoccus kekensis TaxID=714307 RepID=UPI001FE4CAD2|nr:M20 family metallopeptidase [Salinicoccus kekensis]